jgi:hypothetical protein
MVNREKRDLIYESCAAVYDHPEDALIIAEATVIRIEGKAMSFSEFVNGILKRNGLGPKVRDRLQAAVQEPLIND